MSPTRRAACLWGVLTLAVFQSGCGYSLVGMASNIPDHVEKIFLESIENQTRRPQVDQIFTRAISEELVTRKRFALTDSESGADARLSGAVTNIMLRPLSFDDEGAATEYQITIDAKMEFRDLLNDEVIWHNDRYSYRETFIVDRQAETFFDREQIAIRQAASRFARAMVIDLLEGF